MTLYSFEYLILFSDAELSCNESQSQRKDTVISSFNKAANEKINSILILGPNSETLFRLSLRVYIPYRYCFAMSEIAAFVKQSINTIIPILCTYFCGDSIMNF